MSPTVAALTWVRCRSGPGWSIGRTHLSQVAFLVCARRQRRSGSIGVAREKREFGELSRTFFAKLTNESMNYFLSKTLATHLGEGQRFATMNEMGQFEKALTTHCKEASLIVEQFSADWFSKHKYEEGGDISRESSNGFASYALKKMKDELKEGARTDAR